MANLVKIPRLSSDENQRIRVGELRRKLSGGGRAHRSRAIEELSRKKYNLQLGRNIICSWKFIICSCKKYHLQLEIYYLQLEEIQFAVWKEHYLQLKEM